jgi:uncharacterized protein YjiS (DUF1127 family)
MQKSTASTRHPSFFAGIAAEMARAGVVSALIGRLSNLRRRNKLVKLDQLEDRMLDDIGLTRLDLAWARRLPLGRNPLAALDEIACERGRERRRAAARALPGTRTPSISVVE